MYLKLSVVLKLNILASVPHLLLDSLFYTRPPGGESNHIFEKLPGVMSINTRSSFSTENFTAASATPWGQAIRDEWTARQAQQGSKKGPLFPLAANPFGEEEILAMVDVLMTGRLTLGIEVERAEEEFARRVNAPYAVMVNSGSSANLLAVAAMANRLRALNCQPGDEVLVPAVCWSTSFHPIVQCGLTPVLVDVDPKTFNVTLELLESKMTSRVKAMVAVHVLGNCIDMDDLMAFVAKHKLILMEDTCESLGSYAGGDQRRMLGTFGDFGTYSFYFSHHITSGEGGMVVCKTLDDYNLLRCLRAHGWTRHQTNREELDASHPEVDSRFLFINVGFNLRPLEVQGAMLSVQLRKLDEFNAIRRQNLEQITGLLRKDSRFDSIMQVMEASKGSDPAWFGLGCMLDPKYAHQLSDYLVYLEKNGVENRPVIGGNFARQPCVKLYCPDINPADFVGAEAVHKRGFFIGIHQTPIEPHLISKLVDFMLNFEFKAQE